MKALAIYGGAALSDLDFHFVVVFFVLTGVLLLVTGLILFVPSARRKAKNKRAGEIPEQKKKMSKLCLAGFIIAALYPLLLAFDYFGLMLLAFKFGIRLNFDRTWLDRAEFFVPFIAVILSIAGVITAGRKGKAGKKFGVAGIVLPNAYVAIIVLMIIGNIVILIVHNSRTVRIQEKREVFTMRNVGAPANTEYDVSRYSVPEGYDLKSMNTSVSEAELKEYAESKLQTIDSSSDKSVRGKFQKSDFVIVRSDRLVEWLSDNNLNNFGYRNGKTTLAYDYTWEFAATGTYTLDVYKDPSDRFIIITNCGDQKVIAEFFEGIGKAVPTEKPEESEEPKETADPEARRKYEQLEFLKDNINSDMSLHDIVDVFEKTCKQSAGKDKIIFKYGVDRFNGRMDEHFGFCLTREYKAEDGKTYQIHVDVLYGLTVKSRSFKKTQLTNNEVDGDFFEYIRNSDAYKYAQTAKIYEIQIHMNEIA